MSDHAGIGVGVESRKIPSYWQYGVVDNVSENRSLAISQLYFYTVQCLHMQHVGMQHINPTIEMHARSRLGFDVLRGVGMQVCPECLKGSLDLSRSYTVGDGRWDIEWFAVPCNVRPPS